MLRGVVCALMKPHPKCLMPYLIASKARTCRWAAKNLQEQQDVIVPCCLVFFFAGKRHVCPQDRKRLEQALFTLEGVAVKEVGIQAAMGYSCETHQHVGISRTPSHTPTESAAPLCERRRNFVSRSDAAPTGDERQAQFNFSTSFQYVATLLLPNLNNQPVSNSLQKRRRFRFFVWNAGRIYWGHMLWKPSGFPPPHLTSSKCKLKFCKSILFLVFKLFRFCKNYFWRI